ncbi:hypothetical protein WJX79_010854 [Trebouxia sp. C0005]
MFQTFVAEVSTSYSYDSLSGLTGRCCHTKNHGHCFGNTNSKGPRTRRHLVVTEARVRGLRSKLSKKDAEFKSSRDLSQMLLGGQWLDGLKTRWHSFAEQASSPSNMLSGAATATAAVLLTFPFHSSFPDKIAKIMSVRPEHVSAEVWLLSIALSSLVPAAIYVGMTWRVLHRMNRGRQESDQAVAVVAALCVKNGATIEKFMMLLDGLDSHPSIGPAVTRMRESTKKQLDLQEILFSRMVVRSEFVLQQHLGHAVQAAAADLEKANITRAEAIALLDYDKREMMPNNSLLYKVDKYDKILALMLLRQRGMRLTIISILEDLAVKLPPVRRNIELVRLQFAARFKHEDLMMQQITPPGFNAAEKVRHLLHSEDMVSSLAAHGVKPDDVLGSLLGPWGASSPQTDLKRHEMEKLISSASADSSETRIVKQELERLLSAQLPDDEPPNAKSDLGSSDSTTDAADAT